MVLVFCFIETVVKKRELHSFYVMFRLVISYRLVSRTLLTPQSQLGSHQPCVNASDFYLPENESYPVLSTVCESVKGLSKMPAIRRADFTLMFNTAFCIQDKTRA